MRVVCSLLHFEQQLLVLVACGPARPHRRGLRVSFAEQLQVVGNAPIPARAPLGPVLFPHGTR